MGLEKTLVHELTQLRQAVSRLIASLKMQEQEYNQTQAEVAKCEHQIAMALQNGDKALADKALIRQKSYAKNAGVLKVNLEQQREIVEKHKKALKAIENRIAQENPNNMLGKMHANSVEPLRDEPNTDFNLELTYVIDQVDDVDDELRAMKRSMGLLPSLNSTTLPSPADIVKPKITTGDVIDAELEEMRRQLGK